MIWFITLVLYICLLCAIQKRCSGELLPADKNAAVKPPVQPLELQGCQGMITLPAKGADRKWLFELGF